MVNEEKAEYLDLLTKQLTFTFQVGADSLTYLNTTQVIFVDSSHSITFMQHQAIDKADSAFDSVNTFHNKVVLVLVQFSTLGI